MEVAVVGGGVTGLFAALYLKRGGAHVTLYERSHLGAGSVHAAGILEGPKCEPINNWSYLKTALRHLRTQSSVLRRLDHRWMESYTWNFGKPVAPEDETKVLELGSFSSHEYRVLSDQANDFDLQFGGLTEVYDTPATFEVARAELEEARTPPEAVATETSGGGGTVHHPEMGWLDTELLVARLSRELEGTEVVKGEVGKLTLKGDVTSGGRTKRFDSVVLTAGVACRRMGIPITAVKGFGWRVRTRETLASAMIFADSGFALVPLSQGAKLTGGFDYSFSESTARAAALLDLVRRRVSIADVGPVQTGFRPTSPDGLPIIGRRENVVVATGAFTLGWTCGPGMAHAATDLALGHGPSDPFFGRFLHRMRDGDLAGAFGS